MTSQFFSLMRPLPNSVSLYLWYGLFLVAGNIACGPLAPKPVEQIMDQLTEEIDFNFHIRPILSDRCFKCHGPDHKTREADLRLDLEENAFAHLESGNQAFSHRGLRSSEAWWRIISDDSEYLMPPPESHLVLSDHEKALIGKWIKQGARWKNHWAFARPEKPDVPKIMLSQEGNEIDAFIQARLAKVGLKPSDPSTKERLVRRVSMDLTGLPPSLSQIDAFMRDESPDAYERFVDDLLDQASCAERLALEWLDVARYGDTQGLHQDVERRYWPWRDWVISAFRENMPYDQFIIWQMAGDLLPGATNDQQLATSFHRLHPISSEGGISNEEFRQKYVQDRTNTTATAFLGLTLECASCHDHKFDPISQTEYYQMTAFFDNIDELGLVNEAGLDNGEIRTKHASGPVLLLPDSTQKEELERIRTTLSMLVEERQRNAQEIQNIQDYFQSLDQINPPKPKAIFAFDRIKLNPVPDGVVHRIQNNMPIDKMIDENPQLLACGNVQVVKGQIGSALRSENETDIVFIKDLANFEVHEPYSAGAWILVEKGGEVQTIMGNSGALGNGWRGWDFYVDTLNRLSLRLVSMLPHNFLSVSANTPIPLNKWTHVFFTYDGGGKAAGVQLFVNGQTMSKVVEADHLEGTIKRRWRTRPFWQNRPLMVFRSGRYHTGENGVFQGCADQLRFYDQELTALEIHKIYRQESTLNPNIDSEVAHEFNVNHHLLRADHRHAVLSSEMREQLGKRTTLLKQVLDVMVMHEMDQPRRSFVLNRGQYDQPTKEVFPQTPEAIGKMPSELPLNRLGLAQWLTDPGHPLTARVAVNRYWQMIFGKGIVATPHDFGTQGKLPSHPQLLDYLAVDFVESGWDVKRLIKKMVMSHTYRQKSTASNEATDIDPKNTYYSHAPSYRLQAEMIRDNALAASGLLIDKIGGPSAKPYQPPGVWSYGSLVSGDYVVDTSSNRFRRSMYTYVRRTTPHPAMIAFDAPDRLVCTVKRENTNTPIQALVLLNDPQFVEAACHLARRVQSESLGTLDEELQYVFRLLCGRIASDVEMKTLRAQFHSARQQFDSDLESARQMLANQGSPLPKNPARTASLAVVANTVMSFDEFYMKR